ncbi:intermediate chain 2, putative [Ichthyophthirius multifiliis]|uniref:Intermediate chain 2, putative n=1 Tax=Ichthyophthirius multifiliis TaxID=5932 RepID=G0QTP7_ICHMU|nr:intermediate chain 2, putative [Ichthyophthirius multifiliis]EGR31420.1 intermediate chain 2, putative [Ichthyophthirius multifiliis]|eukprot:XP_004034906.1 intermediate chain 2, putative [Ichthyophthirius multifiliis]
MTEFYTYQKLRKDFYNPVSFADTDIKVCGYFPQVQNTNEYVQRNPNFIDLDNIAELSEHSVNTERVKTGDKGMLHKEGGWPANVDPSEAQETLRYKKRIEKDTNFPQSVKELKESVEKCIKQNNQIDLLEEYFQGEVSDHIVENLSSKTLMLFKNEKEEFKRSVSEISWQPDQPAKIAVSYAIMRFQQMPEKMNTEAYVWDLVNPNVPDIKLLSPSPITNIAYNQKLSDQIGGGCYNGLVAVWDVRKGDGPAAISPVENSHYEPVTHFHWLMSKTGSECVTTSTDGRVMWWDTRKFDAGPVEKLNIVEGTGENEEIIGGTALEYNVEAGPSKFLIGTESGSILTANKKPKKAVEISHRYGLEQGRHLGPIYSVHRSNQNTKYFLSVGDWSCKIWNEELKSPIIRTKYHGAYLSDGCWSPTRSGAFFLVRRDGWMDVWDYYYRQNEIAFSHKVSDAPLTCIKINQSSAQSGGNCAGKLCAIGDQDGTVTILELCESLYTMQPKEKDIINEMFEREYRKEKNLEQIKKQQELAKKGANKEITSQKEKWEKKKVDMIEQAEQSFLENLKKNPALNVEDELADLDSPSSKLKEYKRQESQQQNNYQQQEQSNKELQDEENNQETQQNQENQDNQDQSQQQDDQKQQ